jgi:hypothetical protein
MKRVWTAEVDPDVADREEALADAVNEGIRMIGALDRLGGTLAITPLRGQTGMRIGKEYEYATVGFLFTWDSYAPGLETPAPPPPEPEPVEEEPEPVEEELEPVEEELEPEPVAAE